MICKEAHHKYFNEPLAYMNPTSVQTYASPDKPRNTHHHELKFKMIDHVIHNDIEFWQPKNSCGKDIKFHEDISEVLDALVSIKLVYYP